MYVLPRSGRCYRMCNPTSWTKDLLKCVLTNQHAPDDDCAAKHFRRVQRGSRDRGGGGGRGSQDRSVPGAASYAAAASAAPMPMEVVPPPLPAASDGGYRIPKRTRGV